jgi:bifunctional oligoribonuclease and PAP phosphatase NrnA
MQRVGESIREVLGELIQRQVKDPRIGFVTITAVRVKPDLSKADVYYTVLGEETEKMSTQAGLESAKPFLRSETGRRVRLKTLPDLEFHLDDTPEKGQQVDSIIQEIHSSEPSFGGATLPPLPVEVDGHLNRAVELLEGASSVGIACHVRPDGDAIGCVLALAMALKGRGVEVQPTWDAEEVEVPPPLDFLPGQDLLVPMQSFRPPEVAVAADCADAERLGRLADRMKKAKALINIDHHVSNAKYGTVNVVDDSAASTAELMLHLISRLGEPITADVATCLYVGLVTDSGRFSYASTTPRTHATAAFLLQRGVEVDVVSQALFESYRFGFLRALGRVLERAQLEGSPEAVVSYLTKEDRGELGVSIEDTDDVIDTLRSARECDVTVLLKELDDGTWKGSFRSKGETDVGSVAASLGGGGHRLAAGFELELPLEEALDKVRKALRGTKPGT